MATSAIDFGPLRRSLATLGEALTFWNAQPSDSPLKPHLRSAVIQSFEFSYELSVRLMRRLLAERADAASSVLDLSFNDLLRAAAAAGWLADPLRWREWREMRNATSHAYDEATAQAVAGRAAEFLADGRDLLSRMEAALES